jgi:hypothetical protein
VAQTLAEPSDFAILLLAVTAVPPLQISPNIFANQIAKQTRVERLLSYASFIMRDMNNAVFESRVHIILPRWIHDESLEW